MPNGGWDGKREDMMGIACAGIKSDYVCDEAYEKGTALKALIESIPANVARSVPAGNLSVDVNVDGNLTVAIAAPLVSQTKGCGRDRRNNEMKVGSNSVQTSTYKRKLTVDGQEVIDSHICKLCGLKGH
jgi:hypothetical protein